jgi:hypothetical protein
MSWLSASCLVLMCASAAAASAQGIIDHTPDQLQQLTSRRQLRKVNAVRLKEWLERYV